MGTFRVVQGLAVLAFAGIVAIILRDADDAGFGRLAQRPLDLLDDEVAQLGVPKAELGVVVSAAAFDQAEPFRVRREVFLRRHQLVEGVDKVFINDIAALLAGQMRGLAIAKVAPGPIGVKGALPVRSAVFEGRLGADIQIGDAQGGLARNAAGPGRPPANAAIVLQKAADGVKSPARTPARQEDTVALGADDQPLVPQLSQGHLRERRRCRAAAADQNRISWRFGIGPYVENSAGDLLKTRSQLPRGERLRGRGFGVHNDHSSRQAVLGDNRRRRQPNRCRQQSERAKFSRRFHLGLICQEGRR